VSFWVKAVFKKVKLDGFWGVHGFSWIVSMSDKYPKFIVQKLNSNKILQYYWNKKQQLD